MAVPGFPPDSEWEQMNYTQKCNALAKAVDQVWGSLVLTGQQIMSEIHQAKSLAETRERKLEARIAVLEGRLAQEPGA
jgi:hypothetical protein